MTEFEQQVFEALGAIPHGDDCAWEMDPNFGGGFCTCDREQRIAQRVTAAIEATYESTDESAGAEIDRIRWAYDAALRALGVSSGEESTE